MKKIIALILAFVFIITLAACQSNTPAGNTGNPTSPVIKDNIQELDDSTLQMIAFNYLFSSVFSLDEDDVIDYERAFRFFSYAGFYRREPFNIWAEPEFIQYYNNDTALFTLPAQIANNLVLDGIIHSSQLNQHNEVDDTYVFCDFDFSARQELSEYFSRNPNNWTVELPSQIVEEYILGKFNTVVNRSQITGYNEATDTYIIEPAGGSFHYSLTIEDRVNIDDTTIRFICNIIPDEAVWGVDATSYCATFTIRFADGEYSYISVKNTDDETSQKLYF